MFQVDPGTAMQENKTFERFSVHAVITDITFECCFLALLGSDELETSS